MSAVKFVPIVKAKNGAQLDGLNVVYGDKTIFFKPDSLTRGTLSDANALFTSVNALLENYSKSQHKAIFGIYSDLKDIITTPKFTHTERFELDDILGEFFKLFPMEALQAWGSNWPGYVTAASTGNMTELKTSTTASKACSTEEYRNLAIFSTLFKLLVPFQCLIPIICEDNEFNKMCYGYDLFGILVGNGDIVEYPAYKFAMTKAAEIAAKKSPSGVPTGLTALSIDEHKFKEVIVIPKLYRELTKLETEMAKAPKGGDNNISFKFIMALENRLGHDLLRIYGVKTMSYKSAGDDEGNTTHRELTSGGEKRSALVGMIYAGDYENFCEVIQYSTDYRDDLKFPEEEVMTLARELDKSIPNAQVHEMVCGMLFNDVIPMASNMYCPPLPKKVMRAYASKVLTKLNLHQLSALMLCDIVEGVVTQSDSRTSLLTMRFNHERIKEVMEMYDDEIRGHPFVDAVNLLCKGVVSGNFTYTIDLGDNVKGSTWEPGYSNGWSIKDELVELKLQIEEHFKNG